MCPWVVSRVESRLTQMCDALLAWGPGLDAPLFKTRLGPREGPQSMLAVPGGVKPQGACHVSSPSLATCRAAHRGRSRGVNSQHVTSSHQGVISQAVLVAQGRKSVKDST